MGIKERKEKEKERMRQLILETATDLFLTNGIDNVSIRNIAGKIEYSPATIYLYFNDKDEIIEQLKNNFVDDFLSKLKEFGFIKDQFSKLVNFSNSWVEFAISLPNKYTIIFLEKPVSLQQDRIYLQLHEIVSECIHTNRLQRMPNQDATILIMSYLHGLAMLAARLKINFKTTLELKEYLTSLISRFLNNMKGQAI